MSSLLCSVPVLVHIGMVLPNYDASDTEMCLSSLRRGWGLALQVVATPFLQGHAVDQAEDFDVAHCTQIPITRAHSGSKRLRKQGHQKATAKWVETTPKPATRSTTKKLATAECVFADLTLQTPMPESEAGNEFGPPPPDTTPAFQRMNSCGYNIRHSS